MSITVAVIGDGRIDYLERCIASLGHLKGDITRKVLIYDEPNAADYIRRLDLPGWVVKVHGVRRGMTGAVRSAWDQIGDSEFLFHMEEDFVITEPVDLDDMASTLKGDPRVGQLVLKRQPWNPEELAAGGIIECHPDDYKDRPGFVEHTRIFSLNPCLIPDWVVALGSPEGDPGGVEQEITRKCREQGLVFGFWGRRDDPPRCEHIGHLRSQGWAL